MPRFEELIERYHDEIFVYLWRLLGRHRRAGAADAEDLVQEVFLRAYRAFGRLRNDSHHRAWLYKIATNCAYTSLRQRKITRDGLASLRRAADHGAAGASQPECMVRGMIERLPLKQKACVTLRYLHDLDYPEIARILDCSQESARANVYQALRRLRLLAEEHS